MPTDEPMAIHGERAKPWKLYRLDPDGKDYRCLAAADTEQELWKIHKPRGDFRYRVYHNRLTVRDDSLRFARNQSTCDRADSVS
jgi:hypothetical protein